MICNKCGAENSENAKFCSSCGESLEMIGQPADAQEPAEEAVNAETEKTADPVVETETVVEEVIEEKAEGPEWYYVVNNASTGPYTETEMKKFIEQGALKPVTYVWKNGMEDWVLLKDSELAKYLPHANVSQNTSQPNADYTQPQPNRNYYGAPVQERSIALNVILSVVTCGIYLFVWLYLLAKDVNALSASQGKPQMTDPIIVVLLTIVTCGLYAIYFFYRAGKAMDALDSKVRIGDDSALLAIVSIFAEVVAMAILQNSINTFVRYGE